MSKCEIRITLDRDNPVYSIGDTLNCTVHVVVNKAVKCDGLVLRRSWYTHGRGNRDSDDLQKITLFKGEWQPGEYSYPCSFEIDSGPLTYHGHYINVDWMLEASADIPWATDPDTSVDFVVERGEGKLPQMLEEPDYGTDKVDMSKYRPYMLIAPLIFTAIGSGFAIQGWISNDGFSLLFGSLFIVASAIIAFLIVKNSIAQRKLGKVSVTIDRDNLHPGDETNISVSFTPKTLIEVNHITAKLSGKEKAVSGSGTNRTTHTHTFHEQIFSISNACQLTRDLPVHRRFKISIPPDAHHTFIAADNSIEWTLELTIDINNWPDWSENKELQVLM